MTITIPQGGLQAQDLFSMLLSNVDEWVRIHETESTKRAAIRAQEQATLADIQAKRDLFLSYLERSFDERRAGFDRLFDALDTAMREDPAQVGTILSSITALAMKSPFADLSNIDLIKERLQDPNHVWEV